MGLSVLLSPVYRATSGLSEGRSSANKIELSLSKTVQIVFGQAAVAKQVREHEWKNGIAIVIPSVNLPPTLRQPTFQTPQLGGLLDLRGPAFNVSDESLQLFAKRPVESSSGDCFFGIRPLKFVHGDNVLNCRVR
jgi:hypothetical protein